MPEWDRPQTSKTTLTDPHIRLKALLSRAGFYVEDELNTGRFWIDCYVRELHLGFEADGPHHRPRAKRKKDIERDLWIAENTGILILRVTDKELSTAASRETAYMRILDFIDEHSETIEERRHIAESSLGGSI